jgi:hypothetical protein
LQAPERYQPAEPRADAAQQRAEGERGQAGLVARRVEQVTEVLAGAPKTLKWRARAKIGRRVPWYDFPEEVG